MAPLSFFIHSPTSSQVGKIVAPDTNLGYNKMKKIVFILAVLFTLCFGSCTKESSYVFVDNTTASSITQDVRLMEYDSNGSIVAVRSIDNCQPGTKKEFVADSHADKVVCQLQWEYSGISKIYYVSNVFYLKEGETITIEINGQTMISNSNPI